MLRRLECRGRRGVSGDILESDRNGRRQWCAWLRVRASNFLKEFRYFACSQLQAYFTRTTTDEWVGFYRSDSNLGHSRSTSILERIRNWLEPNPWLGVVWTDSVSNFKCKTGIEFSVPAALQYLRSLPENSLIEAKRYVENAPSRVDTQLRRALVEESWWKDI